ncbi:MAG TPA: fumarylacetoacetase, partial [Candidatus Sulfopaludibacter sp.]|nr:fumarylacetoacetase [Candidatus Sulfopaludibacter sp.]
GFPLQSLPYCIFAAEDGQPRIGVGIGGFVLDLNDCAARGLFDALPAEIQAACGAHTLNRLMACGASAQAALRSRLMELLDAGADTPTQETCRAALTRMEDAALRKPVDSANYTDFYASIHHATRVGRLFRPEEPLLPNYKFVPIGYHGRASSLVVSGTEVRRPRGQTKPDATGVPGFGPTRFLDYEVEVGMYIAGGNSLGEPIPAGRAGAHIFGLSLVNDWSARDIQSWEYQPLGPFLAKSFATSVSPWVVPMAALAPFRVPAPARPADDPAPLPHLYDARDQEAGAIDLTVEAFLLTPAMRTAGLAPQRLSQANLRDLYWTPAQLVAHHTSNGCNLLPGDLLATGTISGAAENSSGCLLELTANGSRPVTLPNGEIRAALEDGDEVILRGCCRREGFPEISLGDCRGVIVPGLDPNL